MVVLFTVIFHLFLLDPLELHGICRRKPDATVVLLVVNIGGVRQLLNSATPLYRTVLAYDHLKLATRPLHHAVLLRVAPQRSYLPQSNEPSRHKLHRSH